MRERVETDDALGLRVGGGCRPDYGGMAVDLDRSCGLRYWNGLFIR